MSTRTRLLVVATIGFVSAVGCADAGTGADPMPTATAEAIATMMVDIDATAGWSATAVTDKRNGTRDFNQTTPCPGGGTRGVSGSGSSSFDEATRVVSMQWTTTQTQTGCTFTNSRGSQSVTAVIDGKVTVTGSASYKVPATLPGERTIVSYSSKRVGSTTTKVGDRTRTCEINVTETWEGSKFHVAGTVCGKAVDVTRSPIGKRDA